MIDSVASIEDIILIAKNELVVAAATKMFLPARAFLLRKVKGAWPIEGWVNRERLISGNGPDVWFEKRGKESGEILNEVLDGQWAIEEVGCFSGNGEDVLLEIKFPTNQTLTIGLQEQSLDENKTGYNVLSVKYMDPIGHSIRVVCVYEINRIEVYQMQDRCKMNIARDENIIIDARVERAEELMTEATKLLHGLLRSNDIDW